jgi:hypothetical protein
MGIPCTASRIGLANAAPLVATEKLKVAALPAGTICVVAPVAAMEKSDAAPTTTLAIVEVLGKKLVSPEYAAVRVCVPSVSVPVVNAAPPAASGMADTTVVPSSNVTLPVGTPLVVLDACMVSVTGRPEVGLVVDADSRVSVGACVMVKLAGVRDTV